jgi:hypothetical protein
VTIGPRRRLLESSMAGGAREWRLEVPVLGQPLVSLFVGTVFDLGTKGLGLGTAGRQGVKRKKGKERWEGENEKKQGVPLDEE